MTMTVEDFRRSLEEREPPAHFSVALQALWWMSKGDWDRAHDLVNEAEQAEECWVHAHLHRVEGDLANAGYWYRRARRAMPTAPLDAERNQIVRALIGAPAA